ncbi:hypothetical protein V3C99_002222 [Haemonchus contortus]
MMNDLAPELCRRKRAAWGAFKNIEGVVKKTKIIRLRAHLFDTAVLPALTRSGMPLTTPRNRRSGGPDTLCDIVMTAANEMVRLLHESSERKEC